MLSQAEVLQARALIRRGIRAAEQVLGAPSHATRILIHGPSLALRFDPADRTMHAGEGFALALLNSARKPRRRSPADPEAAHGLLCEAVVSLADPGIIAGRGNAELLLLAEHANRHLPHVRTVAGGLAELTVAMHHRRLLQALGLPHLLDAPAARVQQPAGVEAMREVVREGASILGMSHRDTARFMVCSGMGYFPLIALGTRIHEARGLSVLGDHAAQHMLLGHLTHGMAVVQFGDSPDLSTRRRQAMGRAQGQKTMAAVHGLVRARALSPHGERAVS